MEEYKYVRFDNGKIILLDESNKDFDLLDGRYCKNVLDLLEKNDFVRIEYYSPKEDKIVNQLFQVDFVEGNYITLKNTYMNFIIKNGYFISDDLNPIIRSIITKENIQKMEYSLDEKQEDYALPSTIKKIASGLVELYSIAYIQIKPQVENIINNNIKDMTYIEYTLDGLLNVPYEPCNQLFVKLCNYVSTFDKDCANEYMEIYEDLYGEEEVKEKKKTI